MSRSSYSSTPSRRQFLRASTTASVSAPLIVSAAVLGKEDKPAPSGRIRLGIIGVNGMGQHNLANCAKHPDVVVTAVCDVAPNRRDAVVAKYKPTAKGYQDFRELLARPDVDAVIIATPPHWHALMAIQAVEAGKDIYVQKPMTLYPDETLAVRNAVQRHKRISQVGTQIHASENYRRVVEWIRSGKLGPVSVVRTLNVQNQGVKGIGRAPKQDPPPGVDWDMWCGPAPLRPFNSILFANSFNHCSFFDYSGGWTPGMAPHIIDLPIWALDLGAPLVTSCSGGRFVLKDDGDAPDVQEVLWQYPHLTMTWMMSCCSSYAFDFGHGKPARRLGIYFHAFKGALIADYGRHEVVAEGDMLKDKTPPKPTLAPSPGHEREWLDCIKTRQQPSCSVAYHWKVDIALTLANLSYRLKRSVRFDPEAGKIVGDAEAVRLARPQYRSPWKFPEQYL
jgi:predicted dehydrogenase